MTRAGGSPLPQDAAGLSRSAPMSAALHGAQLASNLRMDQFHGGGSAWGESLSEHQNCLDHSRNHPTVPPSITAGTTMSDIATLSSEYQVSIPKRVRESRNWKPSQKFAFIPKNGGYLLVAAPTSTTSLASPRAPAPKTTAIARTATDVRYRYLRPDRVSDRLARRRHRCPAPPRAGCLAGSDHSAARAREVAQLRTWRDWPSLPLAPSGCLAAKACRTRSIA